MTKKRCLTVSYDLLVHGISSVACTYWRGHCLNRKGSAFDKASLFLHKFRREGLASVEPRKESYLPFSQRFGNVTPPSSLRHLPPLSLIVDPEFHNLFIAPRAAKGGYLQAPS